MPPIQDQGEWGFCYAFASTAIYHQYACRTGSDLCQHQDSLSVLDAVGQWGAFNEKQHPLMEYKKFKNIGEGGIPEVTLKKLAENGICPEKYAPYPTEFFKNYSGSSKFAIEQVFRFYEKFHESKPDDGQMCDYAGRLTEMLLGSESGEEHLILLNHLKKVMDYNNSAEFFQDALISKECINHRQKVKPYKVKKEDNFEMNMQSFDTGFYGPVFEQLSLGRALTFSIDTVKAFPGTPQSLLEGNTKHAIAVIGNKFENGKCYLKVQNSWGEKWQKEHNDGWMDAEILLQGTETVNWMEEE